MIDGSVEQGKWKLVKMIALQMERVNFIANGSKCGIKFGDTMRRSHQDLSVSLLNGECFTVKILFFGSKNV